MEIVPTRFPSHLGGFHEQAMDRGGFARHFASVMSTDPRFSGRVLDVGCGEHGTLLHDNDHKNMFHPILGRSTQLDGVDPDEGVRRNPNIVEKYCGLLEDVRIPDSTYDAIVSFFVLEHVTSARFFEAVFRVLRPGGVFYAITPHSHHPFAICTSVLDMLGLKGFVSGASASDGVNPYPTYNRFNSRRSLERTCRRIGFSRLSVYLAPCVQWDTYFPRWMRFIPHTYDRALGSRFAPLAQQLMVKIEKAELSKDAGTPT